MADKIFNKNEKIILKTIFSERKPLSIKELSEKADMSWSTVSKYSKKLQKENIVIKKGEKEKGNKKVVLNYALLK